MGSASAVDYFNEYQLALKHHEWVIVLFKSQYCEACVGVGPLFENVAEKYAGRVKGLVLDTETIAKVEGVDGTPTLVVYKDGKEVENHKGIGDTGEQQQFLEDVFSRVAPPLKTPSTGTDRLLSGEG
ncbi:thioredoxin family protein [Pseudomonas sp. AMR01]|uniref:thioredoxin family protein n=1 Tax=Pseudomonas sp. AMR01 TaxID=3064904 RepID=UPI0035C09CB7